eukprot:1891240-Rhodomonas_salina.1
MALDLEFEHRKYQPLIHGTLVDDFEDPVFQNPLVKISNCSKNFNYIVTSIVSFSAQLSTSCLESFPHIFMNQDLQVATHPLT